MSITERKPRSESELSDPKDNPAVAGPSVSSSPDNLSGGNNDAAMSGTDDSDSSQDQDAEGSEDGDYDMESPAAEQSDVGRPSSSGSEQSTRPHKRKSGIEDDAYIMKDPELYGLRRSSRARSNRRIVESSSEESDSEPTHARKKRRTNAATRASKQVSPAVPSSPSDSDSDDVYVGSRRQALTQKQRRQQLKVAAGLAPPSQTEVRFSTRRAAKVQSYNEDEYDDFSDEESETTPSYWTNQVEDDSPAIDAVLNFRPKEGKDMEKDEHIGKHDFEFLIKWQNQAHYHATWETFESLTNYRGYKRLENYYRKVVLEALYILRDEDVPPEDKERWALEREKTADALLDANQVERVIGQRQGEDGLEYYVKWKSLPYDYCTWESEELVTQLSQVEIDNYLNRTATLPTINKAESKLATRSKHTPINSQPDYIKFGQLRDFQLKGLNFLAYNWCQGNNVILADEMGLGKTVQTVSFMNWLRHDRGQHGPFLVVVPLSTLPAWAETFSNWTPDLNYVVYNGKEEARRIIQEHELLVNGNPKKVKFHALLTTYEFILQDASFLSQINWQFMAVDEAHRLKNRESQLYAKLMEFGAPSRLLITGTPIQNTLSELSALMDFLMPGKVSVDENLDLQSETASLKLQELTRAIEPYMIRRTKQKVENDLPPKTEKIIRVELADFQLENYKNILTRNYEALNQGTKGQKQNLLNIMMELKKASNHPFMLAGAEQRLLGETYTREESLKGIISSSGKMMLLDQLLAKLKKDGHRVLIFSQMVKMLDILSDYMQLRGYQYQRLDGTIASGPRRQAIDHFNAEDSADFAFLLSTRAGGLGINLMTADTVIIFDSDWNPQADLQAMARAHRIGQKKPVTVYRLVSKDTVEEEVIERARNKLILEYITIQRGITDKETRAYSDKYKNATAEPTSSEDIDRILKRRSQKMFEQSGNQKRLEELDIDAVLENAEEHKTEQPAGLTSEGGEDFLKSFEYTDVKVDLDWDDIIPEEQLKKIKAEQQEKDDAEMAKQLEEQNAPRKRKAPSDEREQRIAKKRARQAAAQAAAEAEGSEEESANADPKRPLSEKEIRHLIKAYERYGLFEERRDEIIRDARLVGRDIEVITNTLKEILSISEKLVKEEQARLEDLEKNSNKVITKKDKKAILFNYNGVKRLNAETLLERPEEMRMLKRATQRYSPDIMKFRVKNASKSASYTCEWGVREDAMLCIGIDRHGYGAWTAIRDDPELGLKDKFFLEEHRVDNKEKRTKADDNARSPGAVHLVRRANYLLSVIKDNETEGQNPSVRKSLENHHRNNKKLPNGRSDKYGSNTASPVPGASRAKRESEKPRHRHSSHSLDRRERTVDRTETPELRRKGSDIQDRPKHRRPEDRPHLHKHSSHLHTNGHTNGHRGAEPGAKQLAAVRNNLEALKICRKVDTASRAKHIREHLIKVGNEIKVQVREGSNMGKDQLWDYVAKNWFPGDVAGRALAAMYDKTMGKEAEAKKPGSATPNNPAAPSPAVATTNGNV